MPRKQIYNKGDLIGTHQLEFIREVEPKISPSGKIQRRMEVICPICGRLFITYLKNLNRSLNGVTKPVKQCPECSKKEKIERLKLLRYDNKKDLTGQRFGYLLVLGDSGERTAKGEVKQICQCICGNIIKVRGSSLTSGNTTSCGCRTESKGEEKVRLILDQLELNFEQEKIFNDCINPKTNAKLRFDFYLPSYNICIEYDGKQHFETTG